MTKISILKTKPICQVESCDRKYKAKGFCEFHYGQMYKWGEIRPLKTHEAQCIVEGCNGKFRAKGYCLRHYKQIQIHGKISGNPKKLKYGEINRCVFNGNTCHIELYDKRGNIKAHAIIDAKDYDKVKDIKWSIDGRGYVCCGRRNGINFKLHRIILGSLENDREPDHIDGNKLNNKKSNLRVCTHRQSSCNSKKPKNNTSGYKGVSWDKSKNKWLAQIRFNYKSIHLGRFKTRIGAAIAYDVAAKEYHGKFARLNF